MLAKKINKVVLVDDEPNITNMYKTILESKGYKVHIATDGKTGFEIIKKEKPDLILSDIVMPGEDGFYLLSKVNSTKETKHIPVLMLTNLDSSEDKEQAKKLGANGYLVKVNYTPDDIINKIEKGIPESGFQKNTFLE